MKCRCCKIDCAPCMLIHGISLGLQAASAKCWSMSSDPEHAGPDVEPEAARYKALCAAAEEIEHIGVDAVHDAYVAGKS